MTVAAATVDEVQDAVRGSSCVLPRGGGTRPALSEDPEHRAIAVDVSAMEGIVEYDPAELTLTAMAGTRIGELAEAVADRGQRLAFDPFFSDCGPETLGGAVATGAVGPAAFGGGTLRDFVIGMRIVDGSGNSIFGGGRVVKNAAGFDLPKLMVGSLGRLGVIVEVSLKLFPRAADSATLRIETTDLREAIETISLLARGPEGLQELDLEPPQTIYARLSTRSNLLDQAVAALERIAGGCCQRLEHEKASARQRWFRSFDWVPEGYRLIRVPTTAASVTAIEDSVPMAAPRVYCNALNVAWLCWPEDEPLALLGKELAVAGLRGVVMSGSPERVPLIGAASGGAFGDRVRAVLDPKGKFLELGP